MSRVNTEKRYPVVAASAIVPDEKGRILLVKRKYVPGKGFWAFPGGHVEYGESITDAVVREIKEETGLEIKIKQFLFPCTVIKVTDESKVPEYHYVILVFEGEVFSGELKPSSDAEDVCFFTFEDAFKLNLTASTFASLKRYQRGLETGNIDHNEVFVLFRKRNV